MLFEETAKRGVCIGSFHRLLRLCVECFRKKKQQRLWRVTDLKTAAAQGRWSPQFEDKSITRKLKTAQKTHSITAH